ncbi:MAG: glycosyltransferase [Anaerolinea sp.]|nr:glycosyltransferase [Anaerolinea sp.]
MKLLYLTMITPAPSEVFLAVEVRGLVQRGNTVKIVALRGRLPEHDKLVADQHLGAVEISAPPYFSARTLADMVYWTRRSPLIVLWLVWAVVARCWRRPSTLLLSLVLVPKSFSVARYVEQEGFDAVHFAWGHYPAVTAYLLERLMPDLPLTLALGAYDRLRRNPMTIPAANHADRVLTQSERNAQLIRDDWPRTTTPIQVIYRGIEINHLRAYRGAPTTPGLIVSSARLLPHKGHQNMIRALHKIRAAVPQAHLMIFGAGAYQAELEQLIADEGLTDVITLGGHVPHEQLFAATARASVYTLVSERDWLPNSLKEAMALGVPVITTPTTGMEELVQDGITGLVVPYGDIDATADAVIRVLCDPALAERLTRAALESIEKFDIELTSQQRHDLYESLIGQKHNR